MNLKPSKWHILNYLKERLRANPDGYSCLDLGCGTAELFLPLVREFPNFHYVGLEPDRRSAARAKELYGGVRNAEVYSATAYPANPRAGELRERFDLVLSLSVLEHIKDISSFLKFSVQCAKRGAEIVHLYDLGHALYPSGLKEKIQVALCDGKLRFFVPESKIASYVDYNRTVTLLKKFGAAHQRTSFHNMRSHVSFLKAANGVVAEDALRDICRKEMEWSELLPNSRIEIKEKLFPAIAIWSRKE